MRPAGRPARVDYANGAPGTERRRLHDLAENTRRKRERRHTDPEYRKLVNEYWRIWNNAHNGAVSRLTINVTGDSRRGPTERVNSEPFLAWYERNRVEGVYITEADERAINRARVDGFANLTLVDRVLTQNAEGYLLATLYPLEG